MKICLFTYSFEHKKSYEYLCRLIFEGIKIDYIFAANKIKLSFKKSEINDTVSGLKYPKIKTLNKVHKIKYLNIQHNSEKLKRILKKEKFDLGIVAGARIINQSVIDKFKIGILNIHKGLLPENRGLDTIKWAVLKNLKQGITAHLINEKIDLGFMILKKKIKISQDDSLIDINERLQNAELELLVKSIYKLKSKKIFIKINDKKKSQSTMPKNLEKTMIKKFENYKRNYD